MKNMHLENVHGLREEVCCWNGQLRFLNSEMSPFMTLRWFYDNVLEKKIPPHKMYLFSTQIWTVKTEGLRIEEMKDLSLILQFAACRPGWWQLTSDGSGETENLLQSALTGATGGVNGPQGQRIRAREDAWVFVWFGFKSNVNPIKNMFNVTRPPNKQKTIISITEEV